MPYIVKQLVSDLPEPVCAEPTDSIQDALDTMRRGGFSQLPVMKGEEYYFITQESILTALHGFRMAPSDAGLKVEDALEKVHRVFIETDDLFELLKGMRDTNAALVADENGKLKNIVTTFDTTQFFRQWSEDILHARDIENSLKKIISASFKNSNGELIGRLREDAIAEITPSNKDLRRKFDRGLDVYLTRLQEKEVSIAAAYLDVSFGELVRRRSEEPENAGDCFPEDYSKFSEATRSCVSAVIKDHLVIDEELASQAFEALYNQREQIKPFELLTLEQYIQLFLGEHCWNRCDSAFGVDKVAITNLLNGVRETRNKLAHFREEQVTPQERSQLKMCSEWLADKAKKAVAELERIAPNTAVENLAQLQ
jgi:CBS domain-containing protein